MTTKSDVRTMLICAVLLVMGLTGLAGAQYSEKAKEAKLDPDKAVALLQEGNARFVAGQSIHPHSDAARLQQAGTENQGNYAYATVITCSDSRVPVERLFDAGVMDLFVIRVAGNVCDTDEVGSIEYGLAHVKTPVLVVLGHTQCGAVTAVTHAVQGHGHALERNIPPLVDNIQPAVERAISQHGSAQGDAVIPYAVEENVWQGIEDLFMASPTARDLVGSGKAKVVGAIYDVGTGKVMWLPQSRSQQILARVENNSGRAMEAMATEHGAGGHGAASAEDQAAVASLLRNLENQQEVKTYQKEVTAAGWRNVWLYGFGAAVVVLAGGLVVFYARTKDGQGQTRMSWTLGSKLIGAFGLVVVILAGLCIWSLRSLDRIDSEIASIAEEIIPVTNKVANIETYQLEQKVALERAFRYGESSDAHAREVTNEQQDMFEKLSEQIETEFEGALQLLEEIPVHNTQDAQAMTDVMDNLARIETEQRMFGALAGQALQLIDEGKHGQARLLEDEVENASEKLGKEVEQFLLATEQRTEEAAQSAENDGKHTAAILMIVSIVTVLFTLVTAVALTGSIVKPVNRIISELTAGSEQVAAASGQVSAASQSLAEGATEQAAGLEETSSSLEEMSSMTKQNADNAQQANGLAGEARKAADTGAESMRRMNGAILEIQKSSDETAKIIKVIDDIAFQTNLLALNAAVEAARAGEAGKGFAVVAEEVRNLAMRSAEAAKNTSNMIEESVKNSKNGVDIATEVGKVLEEIVQSVGKTTDLVSEIAAASQEQAQGIDQVNTAVAQMDKVTQQNAANAEESASASEELSAQAESMNDIVGQLVALVGGSASRGNGSAAKSGGQRRSGHGLGKSDETWHRIAAKDESRSSHASAKTKAAANAIPLDDTDSGFNDFNA